MNKYIMNIRHIAMTTLITLGVTLSQIASAEKIELGTPVVALMSHVKILRADLGLNNEQDATLDRWMADAPEK